jgi:hypothetical protein
MKKLLAIVLTVLLVFGVSAAALAVDVHSVIAQRPLYLKDGITGITYNALSGTCTMNWKEKTRYGFFNAKITVNNSPLVYDFQLVAIGNCTASEIEGLWDIKRNGVLVASGIVGKLYGINQPVGSYFKFYGGTTQNNTNIWHVSAYITARFDY